MKELLILGGSNIELERRGKNMRIKFASFNEKMNYKIRVSVNGRNELIALIQTLEKFATKPIKKEEKAYSEDFSTYRNEVERTLSIWGSSGDCYITLNCYTDVEYDDNWIELPPAKLSSFIGHLYGYLNL